jgi:hypothetical protein
MIKYGGKHFFRKNITQQLAKTLNSRLIVMSYTDTNGIWENEKLCGNMTAGGFSHNFSFSQFPQVSI